MIARRLGRGGPFAVGVELAAGAMHAVAVRPQGDRLRVTAATDSAVPRGAISGGLVLDRALVGAALTAVLHEVERGERASRVVVAVDGDDVRTFHLAISFERDKAGAPIVGAEVSRATRDAKTELAGRARAAAAEDPALRAVPSTLLREDLASFMLDGRPLSTLVGYQGRFLDVRADVAVAPLVMGGAISAAIGSAGREASLACGVHALGRLLVASGRDDLVVVNVGTDVTGVALLRNAAVARTRSFSIGRDELVTRGKAGDATVWADCVLEALGDGELPRQWLVGGVGESLAILPRELAARAALRRAEDVEVLPLRVADASRLIVESALRPDHLVAAGAAALAAEDLTG